MPNFYENFAYSLSQAISEFVENSLDSYKAHKDELPDGLDVHIDIDRKRREVRITDNAFGMSKEELATILGPFGSRERVSPKATIGTYGIGLLSASSWMSSIWSVTSHRKGEDNEWSVNVNASNFLEQPTGEPVGRIVGSDRDSYTTILIRDIHSHRLQSARYWAKIKDDLSVRFGSFIKAGSVRICINGVEIPPLEPTFIVTEEPDGTTKEWKAEFTIGEIEGIPIRVEMGVLQIPPRKNGRFSGVTTMWRGRVVERGDLNRALGEAPGDLARQRIMCLVHLDGLTLSYSKNSFAWRKIDREDLIDVLRRHPIFREFRRFSVSYRRSSKNPSNFEKIDEADSSVSTEEE